MLFFYVLQVEILIRMILTDINDVAPKFENLPYEVFVREVSFLTDIVLVFDAIQVALAAVLYCAQKLILF